MLLEKLRKEQLKLAKLVIIEDKFSNIDTVGGCDQAFFDNKIISAIVICDYKTMNVLEKQYSVVKARVPYIPGYLSYREGPAIIKTYKKLKKRPDILLFDSNGILHKLRIGMASHVGVLLDQVTTGVAKHLLCGKVKGKRIFVNDEMRGFILKTKKSYRPLYVSPGHKVSLKTSLKIVKHCLRNHKLPEPLRFAHLYANEVKEKYESSKIKGNIQIGKFKK